MERSLRCLICEGALSGPMTMAVHTKRGSSEVFAILGGKHAFAPSMDTEVGLQVRVCKKCGFVMPFVASGSLHDVATADALGDFKEEPKRHPLYKEFIKEDHSYKSYDGANLLRSFGRWLQKRGE